MLDLQQFTGVQIPFVHPLYSGLRCFREKESKYHPCFRIKSTWFALTHTKPWKKEYMEVISSEIIDYHHNRDIEKNSYLIVCNEPQRIVKKISGYFYIKPYSEFIKERASANSLEDLKVKNI